MLSSLCLRLDGIFSLFRENTKNFLKKGGRYIMPKTKFQNFIFTLMTAVLMAYPLQIFLIGPLVRNIFRIIFKNQLYSVAQTLRESQINMYYS